MKRFSAGDRVFVRTGLLGKEKCATVSVDFDGSGEVLVVVDGKTKARPFAPARVRLQPDLRVVENGAYRTPARPAISPPPARPAIPPPAPAPLARAAARPRAWKPPPSPLPSIPQPVPGTVRSSAAIDLDTITAPDPLREGQDVEPEHKPAPHLPEVSSSLDGTHAPLSQSRVQGRDLHGAPVHQLRAVPKPEPPSRDDRYLAFIREHVLELTELPLFYGTPE